MGKQIAPLKVNKIFVYPFQSKQDMLDYIADKQKILIAINAEKIMLDDDKVIKTINENIGYPDGVGAVMAIRKKGFKATKIPGVELWLAIIQKFEKEKSFYIVGATEEVIQNTILKLRKEFPLLDLKGYRNGYLDTESTKILKQDIVEKKPDVVFIAMGSPRQEKLMEELMLVHPALYQGLGGSFDVYCGKLKRAPDFYLNNGLEWFYRWLSEPFTRTRRMIGLVKFYLNLQIGKY